MPLNSPSQLFKFANVRPAVRYRPDEVENIFIFYNSDIVITGTLFEDLKTLADAGEQDLVDDYIIAVSSYRNASPDAVKTITDFHITFPGFIDIYKLIVDSIDSAADLLASTSLENLLGQSVTDYVSNSAETDEKKLWDNLMAEVIIPTDAALRTALANGLRLLCLFKKSIGGDLNLDPDFQASIQALPILPNPVFPIAKDELTPVTDAPDSNLPALKIAAKAKITSLETARKELVKANEKQNREVFTIDAINANPTDGEPITSTGKNLTLLDSSITLSSATETEISNMGIAGNLARNADYLIANINQEIRDNTEVLFQGVSGKKRFAAFNGSLLELEGVNPTEAFDPILNAHFSDIRPVGIADLLIVEQELIKYDFGDIAHVENIMQSERKDKVHRSFTQIVKSEITETESIIEEERDVVKSDQFALEKQISKVISETQDSSSGNEFGAGVTLSKYGVVDFSGTTNFNSAESQSTSNSKSEANNRALSMAQSVTERAMDRVVERVQTQRSTTTINETEEVNTHGFDNTTGIDHVIGVYHFLDKYYEARVMNYGARLMFEFMVPEPAAFYIYSKQNHQGANQVIERPVHPSELPDIPLSSFKEINESNYAFYASKYEVFDLPVPPSEKRIVGKSFGKDEVAAADTVTPQATSQTDEIVLPAGYRARIAKARCQSYSGWVKWGIGDTLGGTAIPDSEMDTSDKAIDGTGSIPISIYVAVDTSYILNIVIECERTIELFDEWRTQVFTAIMDSYSSKLANYERALAAIEVQQGVSIQGRNPDLNRQIEKEELKRASIELLTKQKFDAFNAMKRTGAQPEIDNKKALEEGGYVKFFEQAFEWHNSTYVFYPYFWGRKERWSIVKSFQDNDPKFEKFLQAGYARVLVPARPEFAETILHYIETGVIWNGEGAPTVDDDLYLSIAKEIKDAQTQEGAVQVGGSWEIKEPTNLVMLQPNNPPQLPDYSDGAEFVFEPPIATLTLTMDGSTSAANRVIEFDGGTTENVTMNWTAGSQLNTSDIITISADGVSQSFTAPSPGNSISGNQAVSFPSNSNKTLTLTVETSSGQSATDSISVNYKWQLYFGFTDTNTPDDLVIQALSGILTDTANLNSSVSHPGGGQKHFCIAFPISQEGSGVSIKLGGFDITSDFNRSTRSFTNASGGAITYVILVSNNTTAGDYTNLEILS